MNLILFIVTGFLIQHIESQEQTSSFTITATVWDPHTKLDKKQCTNLDPQCQKYKEYLCNNLTIIAPSEMIPKESACIATLLATYENGTMEWEFIVHLVTHFPEGSTIDLTTCPTFGRLFSYAFDFAIASIEYPSFSFSINNYSPKPQIQSAKPQIQSGFITATNIQYHVVARLRIDDAQNNGAVVEGISIAQKLELFLQEMYANSEMGDLLLPEMQTNMSNVNVSIEEDVVISFTLTYSGDYMNSLTIETYCDIASILRLSIIDGFEFENYQPLSVNVELASSTIMPPMTTPGLASTLGYSIKTLLFTYVASRILVKM